MSKHPYVPLTQEQHNALVGLLLGDGHLACAGKSTNACLDVARALKDKAYLQYEAEILRDFAAPRHVKADGTIKLTVADHFTPDGKRKKKCRFGTISSPTLTEYYHKWYNDKVKIVPPNLELNAQIIAHWIADDGSIDINGAPYRFQLRISTHGFTKQEVEFLAMLLSKRYGEEFYATPSLKKDGTYWYVIMAYDSACRAMFADIDPYFKMARKRIWDKPESRFWNDPPPRAKDLLKDFEGRKQVLYDVLSSANEDVDLFELNKQMKYAPNKNGTQNYIALNNLLKPYLENDAVRKRYGKSNRCYLVVDNEKAKLVVDRRKIR